MSRQPQATIASILGVATAGVGALYISLITTFDHSHEKDAARQNIFVVLLPTWPIVGVAILTVIFSVATVTLSALAPIASLQTKRKFESLRRTRCANIAGAESRGSSRHPLGLLD
jgi:hypothetical protein